MKLKESQIGYIEEGSIFKGIPYNKLHEDLVDHISSKVETSMLEEKSFADVYKLVIELIRTDPSKT